jgi:hypothetical protein
MTYWPLQRYGIYNELMTVCAKPENAWMAGDASCPRPAGIGKNWRDASGYNFRFDACKFSKKVFAIAMIAEHLAIGPPAKLFWIDADTITHAPVPLALLDRVLPDGAALSCLARQGYHSECGFVGYNFGHTAATRFIKSFEALYHSEAVFQLAEWHDSWVFDWLRNKLQTPTHNIPHKSKGHPFVNSVLGDYMDHMKGNRKKLGRTQKGEKLSHNNVPYWK